ncbi:MAG: TetR/AcrR family transcriptional regulator [Deferrisomatales bacterium]|nr:TetR/AcrR family transcriptional regulator [Deferrisomatales bacterium]
MNRSPGRRAERQQKILAAAVRAFSRQGYHHCTVAQVAREAGVADGTIYLYFQNKEDLLVSAFRHVLESLFQPLDAEIAAIADPLAKLRRLVEMHLELMEGDPDVASFLQFQLRQPETSVRTAISGPLGQYARRIEAILEAGKAAGQIRTDVGTRMLRRLIFGAVDETVSAWLLRAGREPLLPKAAPLLDVILDGIRRPGSACPGHP